MSDPTVVSLFDQDPARSQDLMLDAPAGWPAPPDPAAYHGLPGAIVEKIAPHTEADPVAILAQLLVACGALIGRGAHFQVEATHHHPNQFVVLVGDSVEISRDAALSTDANSGSTISSRLSAAPGSWPAGSRSVQISPSPLERPVERREVKLGSASVISLAT